MQKKEGKKVELATPEVKKRRAGHTGGETRTPSLTD
jgi:hypothetical protein